MFEKLFNRTKSAKKSKYYTDSEANMHLDHKHYIDNVKKETSEKSATDAKYYIGADSALKRTESLERQAVAKNAQPKVLENHPHRDAKYYTKANAKESPIILDDMLFAEDVSRGDSSQHKPASSIDIETSKSNNTAAKEPPPEPDVSKKTDTKGGHDSPEYYLKAQDTSHHETDNNVISPFEIGVKILIDSQTHSMTSRRADINHYIPILSKGSRLPAVKKRGLCISDVRANKNLHLYIIKTDTKTSPPKQRVIETIYSEGFFYDMLNDFTVNVEFTVQHDMNLHITVSNKRKEYTTSIPKEKWMSPILDIATEAPENIRKTDADFILKPAVNAKPIENKENIAAEKVKLAESKIEKLEAEITEKNEAIKDQEKSLKHIRSDFANYKKRTEARQKQIEEQAGSTLAEKLMPSLEALETAVRLSEKIKKETQAAMSQKIAEHVPLPNWIVLGDICTTDSLDNLSVLSNQLNEGIAQTRRIAINVLESEGLEIINPNVGEKFDAMIHEASSVSPSEDKESGVVLEVLRHGYAWRKRLLRPASVKVSC